VQTLAIGRVGAAGFVAILQYFYDFLGAPFQQRTIFLLFSFLEFLFSPALPEPSGNSLKASVEFNYTLQQFFYLRFLLKKAT